jgi:hypothetical protein
VSWVNLAKRMPLAGWLYRYSRGFYEKLDYLHQNLDDLLQIETEKRIEQLLATPRYSDPRRLNKSEYKVFSQTGEDGMIAEIFRRIGTTDRTFVEFAAGDGIENNSRYLLISGWRGLWIEAHQGYIDEIARNRVREIQQGTLRLLHEFISAENIESLFEKGDVPEDFDLLSIDMDRNDYWVWKQIVRYRPRVVVIEYNSIFPPGCRWVVEYAPSTTWDGTSNYGASLSALELLGKEKGYKLVGCNLAGVNAFFVREDLVGEHFCGPFTAENHYEPPRYYLVLRMPGHPRAVSKLWRKPFIIDQHGNIRKTASD